MINSLDDHYVTEVDGALEQQLLKELRARRRAQYSHNYSVQAISGSDPVARLARALECKVFAEFTFDRPITEIMREEYIPFDDHCFFIVAINWRIPKIVGVMRIIMAEGEHNGLNALRRLKTLSDLENPQEPWQLNLAVIIAANRLDDMRGDNTWDVATLAVHPDYRRKAGVNAAIASSLYHHLYRMSVANNIDYWVAILDVDVLKLIQRLARPFHKFRGVETKNYVGAPSTPVYAHIHRAAKRLRWRNYFVYRQLAQGTVARRHTHFEKPELP